jgi:Flp pilus assembly protein CpaB
VRFFSRTERVIVGSEKKTPWALIAAGVTAAAICGGTIFFLQQQVKAQTRLYLAPVAKVTIPAGALITERDVADEQVKYVLENVAASATEVVGKRAASTIYQGEQIRRERLTDTAADRQEVAINIDLARSGLVSPGDLVDVYFLRQDTSWTPQGELVAQNAVVKSLRGADGSLAREGVPPAIALLLVKPEEASKVVYGSMKEKIYYALVKKYKETEQTVAPTPPPAGTGLMQTAQDLLKGVGSVVQPTAR